MFHAPGNCEVPGTYERVRKQCDNHQFCFFFAYVDNDPCPSISKYLEVVYSCEQNGTWMWRWRWRRRGHERCSFKSKISLVFMLSGEFIRYTFHFFPPHKFQQVTYGTVVRDVDAFFMVHTKS